jgi:trans-aconitate methyltransferase
VIGDFSSGDFYRATKNQPHWPLIERATALFDAPGHALDLGCGAGRDTRYLLTQGWRVTAVDAEPQAIALLEPLCSDRLELVRSTFEDFAFPPATYDLVSAQFALPFIPQGQFFTVFARLKQSLVSGGAFAGQFFGVHDEWNTPERAMTFLTREEVEGVLGDLTVRELLEEDKMGPTATRGIKHWHVFHVLARKSEC